jgi:hypothetical protein
MKVDLFADAAASLTILKLLVSDMVVTTGPLDLLLALSTFPPES